MVYAVNTRNTGKAAPASSVAGARRAFLDCQLARHWKRPVAGGCETRNKFFLLWLSALHFSSTDSALAGLFFFL